MKRRTGVAIVAVSMAMASAPLVGRASAVGLGDAAHEAPSVARTQVVDKKRVKQRSREWVRVSAKFARHSTAVSDVVHRSSYGVVPRADARYRALVEAYACIKNSRGHKIVNYVPQVASLSGNSFTMRWQLFAYRADDARTLRGPNGAYVSQQYELCGVGGGHTWNKWNSDFDGAAITTPGFKDILIGQQWGEAVSSDDGIHSTLKFSLGAGAASIDASVPVGIDDNLRFTGSQGYDAKFPSQPPWPDVNRVNGYYDSASTFTFQGTDRYVGNVVHALYELHQRGTQPLAWMLQASIRAHCTRWFQLLGARCASLGA